MESPLRSVICCPATLRPAALGQLHDQLPSDQQTTLAQVLEKMGASNAAAWEGLLIATSGEPIAGRDDADAPLGVIWIQRVAGNSAVIWMPPREDEIGVELLRAAAAFLESHHIRLAQLVVSFQDGYSDELLQRGGFPKFAELLYLYADLSDFSTSGDGVTLNRRDDALQFMPGAGAEPQRLGQLLEQTYVGTLDCPRLDGVRPMAEVLEGYRSQGRHWPEHWYFVRADGVDVGALILAEHSGFQNWEVVYMGLTVAARGCGNGRAIVQFALQVAARHGAERLVLAVDAENEPALATYRSAGFIDWDRRLVYARLQSPA